MARRSSVLVIATLACVGVRVAPARADSMEKELSFGVQAQWVRRLPEVQHSAIDDGAFRPLPDGAVPIGTAATFLGGGFDSELAFDDHVRVPLFGVSIGASVGSAPRVISTLDGSIVEVDTWKSTLLTFDLPGYGFRTKHRRWLFEGAVQPGAAILFTSGSAAQGAQTTPLDFNAITFVLRLDLAACRRLDPFDRACLFVAPAVYEFGWMNGATIGLRWEVGP